MIPLSLYIHLPWCIRKCPYCDFNSHTLRGNLPEDDYIDALIADLEQDLPLIEGRQLVSIFFGGGTPSLFSAQALARLLNAIAERIDFATPEIEITLEANPGTVEQQRFQDYRQAGINRLSIGIQSFSDPHLKKLGRIHDSDEAKKAIDVAKQAGFDNFNLDLMFGLPEQSIEMALADLNTAIGFQAKHISWYQLTLEPNTLFYQQPPVLPDDELIWQMQQQGQQLLQQYGFEQYEVSAYSQKNKNCQHNLNYWQFGDYLGIGAGAHSKITDSSDGETYRLSKYKHPKDYLNTDKAFIAEKKIVAREEIGFEFMLNALRLQQPIEEELFRQRVGFSFEELAQPISEAKEKDLLQQHGSTLVTTEFGKRYLNDLVALFI